MARVIVILVLMFAISAAIFALTRTSHNTKGVFDADAQTTLPLAAPNERGSEEAALQASGPSKGTSAASAQDVTNGNVPGASPAFSTAGVDHKGRASFTGTSSPGDLVVIEHDGKRLGQARADKSGGWSIDFRIPNVRENYDLIVLASRRGGDKVTGPQRALISPAEVKGGLPRVTLLTAELKTEAASEAASSPNVGIVIETAKTIAPDTATLKGKADPAATVRIYLGKVLGAEVQTSSAGEWEATVTNPGAESVSSLRIELTDAAGRELDQADVPLSLAPKSALGEATSSVEIAALAASVSGKPGAHGAEKPSRYAMVTVRKGDSLWRIAHKQMGNGKHWKKILRANRSKLSNPDLIFPGMRLRIPRLR